MASSEKYNLVHITTGSEYKTPLVASQLFDQAQCQAVNKGETAPAKVEAWIISSMREYIDVQSQVKVTSLMHRCPDIAIRMINGISRLNAFPVLAFMKFYRRKLGKKLPVIYHCRGEGAAEWALKLKQYFPADKVVLDVRGYWPAEKLYQRGIEYPELAAGSDLAEYNALRDSLVNTVKRVDALTTVSDALRQLLIQYIGATQNCAVVPCCVNSITGDDRREEMRKSWGVNDDELVIVYSGTTAAYQHLEDLTIPFMKRLADENPKVRLAFFSSEADKINTMLATAGIDVSKVLLKSFLQQEVAAALNACDAGILIRKPTLVNRVANPVKIAEYLASGLPIIIEKGVGGVADTLFDKEILKAITITEPNADLNAQVSEANRWLKGGIKNKREAVRDYVKQVYLWSAAIHVSRKMYLEALEQK